MKKGVGILLRLPLMAGLLWAGQPLLISQELKAAPLGQAETAAPIRLGDLARQLSDQDVATIVRTLPAGARPWLIIGEALIEISLPVHHLDIYLLPESTAGELRRGAVVHFSRSCGCSTRFVPIADPGKPGEWTLQAGTPPYDSYTQVAVAGRTFNQIQGDQNHNRPFWVRGRFDDAEVISVVSFIRLRSPAPVRGIVRNVDDSVYVVTRLGGHASGRWTLRKQGPNWIITSYATLSA